jgi:hypothetical protein
MSGCSKTENDIRIFAEELYKKLTASFNEIDSPIVQLTRDDTTYPECPGVTSANIRNVLIGGTSTGTATWAELIVARAEYEVSCSTATFSIAKLDSTIDKLQPSTKFAIADPIDTNSIIEHLIRSSQIICSRIWSEQIQQKYIKKNSKQPQHGFLSKAVIMALFGIKRHQSMDQDKYALFELQLTIQKRIKLLNECITVCNVSSTKGSSVTITEVIAQRAYNRIVGDPCGSKRSKLDLVVATKNFPIALTHAIEQFVFIDEWASIVGFDATIPIKNRRQKKLNGEHGKKSIVKTYIVPYGKKKEKQFWFMTIDNAFSDSFWDTWTTAIDQMRFCKGLGGKADAYVRCSSSEPGAIFTTARKYTYKALGHTAMEETILSLARFVMKFQRAYVERLYGSDYRVTWDANLLHHVVGPIHDAVYGAHSDFSPLLCSLNKDDSVNVHNDIYLPEREQMQVLTIYYSNHPTDCAKNTTTKMRYTFNDQSIGSFSMGSRGIHIQGPGSQSEGIKHASTVHTSVPKFGVYRCICTTRLSVVPRHGKVYNDRHCLSLETNAYKEINNVRDISDHDHVGIVSKCLISDSSPATISTIPGKIVHNKRKRVCNPDSHQDQILPTIVNKISDNDKRYPCIQKSTQPSTESNMQSDESHKWTLTFLEELYPNVPSKLYDEYDTLPFVPKIAFKDRVRQLTTWPALLFLLRAHYKVYIRKSDGQLYPCLYEIDDHLLTHGQRYTMSHVCRDAQLGHNDRAHVPISTVVTSANVIVLTKRYKQCPSKIDALINAFEQNNPTYGTYDGRITIMGSGGSHKLMGNFAPTTLSTKHDPHVLIGNGQNRSSALNKRLEQLANDQSVMAVFLNEEHYTSHPVSKKNAPEIPKLLFLGYFSFFESRYTCGEPYSDVADEFGKPSLSDFDNLTYRLHPHLRIEGKPFIPSVQELETLTSAEDIVYQKIVIDHDDHSDIYLDCCDSVDWKSCHHSVTIDDAIKQMIEDGEIRRRHIFTQRKMDNAKKSSEEDYHYDSDDSSYINDEDGSEDNDTHMMLTDVSGSSASIEEVVYSCIFNNAACAMRYNKGGIRTIDGAPFATPLLDLALGNTLRTRPTPSSNRSLDVNLCYLRIVLKNHPVLLQSISKRQRCNISKIPMDTLTDIIFQIIVLRYTGRICRFEEYRQTLMNMHNPSPQKLITGLPTRAHLTTFLDYVRLSIDASDKDTMSDWISKQHDGAIPKHFQNNFHSFSRFFEYVASNLEKTINRMRDLPQGMNRNKCILHLDELLTKALSNGGNSEHGHVAWMSHAIIADLEEFVVDPFGPVVPDSVAKGNYSQKGHDMVNRRLNRRVTYVDCLQMIVLYIHTNTPPEHVNVLGFNKVGEQVNNIVNNRPFNAVDAEHFLCKAWLITKLTFGPSRISKYPRLCNAHTHPSRVLHELSDKNVSLAMKSVEDAYMRCNSDQSLCMKLPELCKVSGENI